MKHASNAAKLAAQIFVAIPANIFTIVQSRKGIMFTVVSNYLQWILRICVPVFT